MDYRLLGMMMHERVPRDMVELQQQLVETWTEFQNSVVDEAIEQWRNRLRNCVRAGGHFERLL